MNATAALHFVSSGVSVSMENATAGFGHDTVLAQVYVAYTEVVNFKKSLGDLLGLAPDCTVAACLQRIRHLLDRSEHLLLVQLSSAEPGYLLQVTATLS